MTERPEASQGLSLFLKARDDVEQTEHPEYFQHTATRTEQFQVAALASERNVRCNDDAHTGTVNLRQVCQIQEQLARAAGNQFSQVAAQQLALTAVDGRSSAKVQNGHIAGFPD